MAKLLGLTGPGTLVINGTANRVTIFDENGEIASSDITVDELEALDGISAASTIEERFVALETDVGDFETLANGAIYIGSALNVATEVVPSGDVTITNTGVTSIGAGVIVNADVNASAAISLSKLAALTASRAVTTDGSGILTASSVTSTELGYLSGVTGAIQDQIDDANTALSDHETETATHGISSAIVGESEAQVLTNKTIDADLNTLSNIDNADIKVGAAIARAKLASGTADHVLINDGSGVISSEAQLDETRGGTGIGTYTTGDLLYASGANTLAKRAAGTDGHVLTMVSGVPNWAAGGSGGGGEFGNLGLTASISSGIVINIVQADGSSTPASGTGAVTIQFRSATASTGSITTRSITSAVSSTVNQSASLGTDLIAIRNGSVSGSGTRKIYVYALDNAGTVEIAYSGSNHWDEREVQNTVAVDSGADSPYVLYSTTARTGVAIRLIGMITATPGVAWTAVTGVYVGNKFPEYRNPAEFVGRNLLGNLNSVADFGIGSWAAYADSAGTRPVDGTGGSPNTTLTITAGDGSSTSTTPPGGIAFYTMTKTSGSNRQGEGVSCRFYVPQEYTGRRCAITFPYRITGTYTAGAAIVYVYDIDNSTVLDVFNGTINTATGLFTGAVDLASGNNYRLIIHVAGTDTSGYVINFDDLVISPQAPVFGAPIQDKIAVTLTPSAGFGTTTNQASWVSRRGDMARFEGQFQNGTVAGSVAYLTLPSGYTIDTGKMGSSRRPIVGNFKRIRTGASGSDSELILSFDPSQPTRVYFSSTSASNVFEDSNGSSIFGSSDYVTFWFEVPISGWSSNITLSNSSSFRISSILANGTRVTSTPSQLGEYRTLIKDNAAVTYSDTDGSGKVSASNGLRTYAITGSGAGASTEPNRWVIFVGKNKHISYEFYSATGRTGQISTDWAYFDTDSIEKGLLKNYDPTTGLVTITMPISGGGSTRYVGQTFSDAAALANVPDCYFDIIVSENAQAVGIDPNSIPLRNIAYVKDLKATNVAGGTFTSGAWRTRDLNTLENPFSVSWISLGSNQFTLAPGTYEIDATAPAYATNAHQTKLRNITAGSDTILGQTAHAGATNGISSPSRLLGTFTIVTSTVFEIQHQAHTTAATEGFGVASNFSVSTIYTQAKITKLS